jgi:hypothetical protein
MGMTKNIEEIQKEASTLVAYAKVLGFDLTIRHEPLQPLGMGRHATVISLSPTNGMYRRAPLLPGAIEKVI